MQNYLSFQFHISSDLRELLIAELSEQGFEGFLETEDGMEAYLPECDFSEDTFQSVMNFYGITEENYTMKVVEQQNWNEAWESNYEPVVIAGTIRIRAPFHEADPTIPMELVIQPKTSFGTGHHETTASIMELMLLTDFKGKRVLDFGAGTGILAVLASRLGAASLMANDIDPWAIENISENLALNHVQGLAFIHGDLSAVPAMQFDIILANINRNILLENMSQLKQRLAPNGLLMMSGFYETDLPELTKAAVSCGLKLVDQIVRNQWAAAVLESQAG